MLGVVGLAVALGVLATRSSAAEARAAARSATQGTRATVGPIRDVIFAKGTLAYDHQLSLRVQTGGRVAPFTLREGSAVRRGQELLRVIDPQDDIERSLRQLEQARAEAKLAAMRKEVAALTRLVEIGSSAAWDLEQKKLELNMAAKDVERAAIELRRLEAKLALGSLKSPIDGMVIAVPLVPGQLVHVNEEALTVAGGNSRFIVAYLDAMDVERIAIGQDVVFSDQEDSTRRRLGKVKDIARAIASSQRQNTVKVTVAALEPIADLRLSQQLYVEFVLFESKGALRVPRELVYARDGQKLVNVRRGDEVRAAPILTKPGDATFDMVVAGISASDELLPRNAIHRTGR